ncbi:Uncharacterised protein [Serratia entomophila]|nr:Uncharacterised protein [Serratia entomophila]CAI1882087.1 Uncharacterised protein [Serratia entomophila]
MHNATGEVHMDLPRIIIAVLDGYLASSSGVPPMAMRCGCSASGT